MLLFFLLFLLMVLTQIGTIGDYMSTRIYPGIRGKFFDPFTNPVILVTLGAIILFFFALIVIFRKQIRRISIIKKIISILHGFWEGLYSLRNIRHPFLFVLYSLTIWVLYFFMLYLCFFCFDQTSGLTAGAGLSALVLGSVGIMITPGGIGLYPAIVQETLLLYGIPKTTGLALGWISWSAQTIMILIIGGLSLILLSFNKRSHGQT
jgi:uncharacterized membrane protein YbhN (UPF0104 family)